MASKNQHQLSTQILSEQMKQENMCGIQLTKVHPENGNENDVCVCVCVKNLRCDVDAHCRQKIYHTCMSLLYCCIAELLWLLQSHLVCFSWNSLHSYGHFPLHNSGRTYSVSFDSLVISSRCNIIIIIIIIQHLYSAIVSYAGCRGACGAS